VYRGCVDYAPDQVNLVSDVKKADNTALVAMYFGHNPTGTYGTGEL
jgi:hypothetical protein